MRKMNNSAHASSLANPPPRRLRAISSMATKHVLAELSVLCAANTGISLEIESVGGVDAAKRVAGGEAFDLVFLANDALDKLHAANHVAARVDLMRSAIAVAVPQGHAHPDLSNGAAVRAAVEATPSIGYSTGPSGVYLQGLFEHWGMAAQVDTKLVKPAPGTPVASLIARGEVALGFQQLSELRGVRGVDVVGELPPDIAFVTVFSGAIAHNAQRGADADTALSVVFSFLRSSTASEVIRKHGMMPVE
jgi:molybdate transport system substrate-binding protein